MKRCLIRAMATASAFALPVAAQAQDSASQSPPSSAPAPEPAERDAETTYRMLVALIDEMVAEGLITRYRADALIARAESGASGTRMADAGSLASPAPAATGTDVPPTAATPADAGRVPPARSDSLPGTPAAAGGAIRVSSTQPDVPADLKVDWSRGAPVFSSRDGTFSFKPRGRILADMQTTGGSDYDPRNITTSTLRQFRFGAQGTIGEHLFFQFEADFRRNQTEVNNTFVGYRQRFGEVEADVRIGSLLVDRGLDVATAAPSNPFITLNVNSLALAPRGGVFIMGAAARASGPNWHASLALHGDRIDADLTQSDHRILVSRAHWNPLLGDSGTIHIGGWAYDEALPGDDAAVDVDTLIAGALNANVRVETPALTGVDGSRAFGVELGAFRGPLYLYGEYGERHLRRGPVATFGNATYKALSIAGGWWITGERVPYQSRSGTFVAPRVLDPLLGGENGGLGAFELVGRYERVDHGDVPQGGTGDAITVGLNWHMTNYFRLMFDLRHWRTDNLTGPYVGEDSGNTLAARAEVSF